jgi:hypothetical protein
VAKASPNTRNLEATPDVESPPFDRRGASRNASAEPTRIPSPRIEAVTIRVAVPHRKAPRAPGQPKQGQACEARQSVEDYGRQGGRNARRPIAQAERLVRIATKNRREECVEEGADEGKANQIGRRHREPQGTEEQLPAERVHHQSDEEHEEGERDLAHRHAGASR